MHKNGYIHHFEWPFFAFVDNYILEEVVYG